MIKNRRNPAVEEDCNLETGEQAACSRDKEVQERARRIYMSIDSQEARREQPKRAMLEKEDEHEQRQKRHCALLAALLLILVGMIAARSFLQQRGKETYGAYRSNENYLVTGPGREQDLLLLVNKTHKIPDAYEVELQWLENGSCAVSKEMYGALREMLTAGSTDGREFIVASGYRDQNLQQQLLDEDIAADMEREGLTWQEAYEKETKETMPPGYSEHETGLAVDIVSTEYQVLDIAQEQTRENRWLKENCSEYGFILRYPKGKEEITGVNYEAWHFRYVGKAAAEEITRRGITLEEYLGEAGV